MVPIFVMTPWGNVPLALSSHSPTRRSVPGPRTWRFHALAVWRGGRRWREAEGDCSLGRKVVFGTKPNPGFGVWGGATAGGEAGAAGSGADGGMKPISRFS